MPNFAGELIQTAVGVASLDDNALRGGLQVVADLAARAAIEGTDFDKTGMSVHVLSETKTYERTGGGWVKTRDASVFDIDGAVPTINGGLDVIGDVDVTGNLNVSGTVFSTDTETVLVSDNHMYLNSGYTGTGLQTGGLVINQQSTGTGDTVNGAYVAGVGAASDPELTTLGSDTFAQDDLVEISGSDNNDGLYEVHDHTGTILQLRGIGLNAPVEDFTGNQLVAGASDGATITKVNVAVLRVNNGVWERGAASTTPFPFSSLGGGTIGGTGTAEHLAFFTAGSTISSEAADELRWDPVNKRLALGTAAPARAVHVRGPGGPAASVVIDSSDAIGPTLALNGTRFFEFVSTGAGDAEADASLVLRDATSGFERIAFSPSVTVLNEGGEQIDTRIETQSNPFAFFLNAITNVARIGINGSEAAPALTFGATADLNTGIFTPGADILAISAGGGERVRLTGSSTIFNETNDNADLIVRTVGQASMLFVNGGEDRVQIRTNIDFTETDSVFAVNGVMTMAETTTAGNPDAGWGFLYFKADGQLYARHVLTGEVLVGSGGGGGGDYVPFIQTVAAETATFTAVIGETHVIDTSAGGFTANLPPIASGQGRIAFYFTGVGQALTVDPNAAETIGGKSTLRLYRGHNTIENDGTEWKLVQRSGKPNSRIDPAQITADQDGYSPADWDPSVSHLYVDSDATRTISGFAESNFVDMDQVIVVNDGANDIIIAHDAGTTVSDRVLVDGGSDFKLGPNQTGLLMRDGTVNRWRFHGLSTPRDLGTETLAYAASVDLDLDPILSPIKSLTLAGNVTFTTSNLATGRSAQVRIVGDGSIRTLTFPGGWTFLGGPAPTSLPANAVGILSISAYGVADADVVAGFSFETTETPLRGAGAVNQVAVFSDPDSIGSSAQLTWNGSLLDVVDSGTGGAAMLSLERTGLSGAGNGATLRLYQNDGNPVEAGHRLGAITFQGWSGAANNAGADIAAYAESLWAAGDTPGYLSFLTTPDTTVVPVERMRITSDGRVGIGTGADAIAAVKLHVHDGPNTYSYTSAHSNTPGFQPYLVLYRSRGTLAAQTPVISGDSLGEIQFSARDSTNPARAAKIVVVAEGAPTSLNVPSRMAFFTSDGTAGSAEGAERMRITNSGQVLVGAGFTGDAHLHAEGTGVQFRATRTDAGAIAVFQGPNETLASGNANVYIHNNDAFGIDKGGSLGLMAPINATPTLVSMAYLWGRKENATSGNEDGYLAFGVRQDGVGAVEAMRIASNGNVGVGEPAPSSTLDVDGSFAAAIETVTDDTLDDTNHFVVVDTSAAVRTVNLPAASTCAGRGYFIRNNGTSGNDATIDGNGAETINGATTLVLSDGQSAHVVSDGTEWFTF